MYKCSFPHLNALRVSKIFHSKLVTISYMKSLFRVLLFYLITYVCRYAFLKAGTLELIILDFEFFPLVQV